MQNASPNPASWRTPLIAPFGMLVITLVTFMAEKLLVIRPVHFLTGFLFLYGILGASWYADAQKYALRVVQGQQFSDSLRFFREVSALVPNAKPDTLVLYRCDPK